MFIATRIRPLARAMPRTAVAVDIKPVWTVRGFQSSVLRFNATSDTKNTTIDTSVTSSVTETLADIPGPPTEGEITAAAYDFPWCYNGSSHLTRIPHYPYAKAPQVWGFLNWIPQSIQYIFCKSATERMLRNNTSPEYFPDQFLQGGVNREALTNMMTQELYDRFEPELEKQEQLQSEVSIKLAAVHDGMIKDVWVNLGPKLKFGTSDNYIRWRWQTITIGLRAGSELMTSRDQATRVMMEGVQFKVDVEFDATIDYTIHNKVLNTDVVSDLIRRPLLVRFETPCFEPAEKMVASRSMTDPYEAPIDWNWRISDIDYLLEQDFIKRRAKEDAEDEERFKREMGM
ncbi:hypothetical protein FBU30_010012 [Linnemannia zychae]|nr:hypothetical protein FBU30_010012 [Linnemannia zychae]